MLIGFYLWVLTMILILFIPFIFLKKGKPITSRDVLFFLVGIWVMVGNVLLISLFD